MQLILRASCGLNYREFFSMSCNILRYRFNCLGLQLDAEIAKFIVMNAKSDSSSQDEASILKGSFNALTLEKAQGSYTIPIDETDDGDKFSVYVMLEIRLTYNLLLELLQDNEFNETDCSEENISPACLVAYLANYFAKL